MKLLSVMAHVLGAGLLLCGPSVHAAGVQYDGRLSGLAITVIDLTPGDGVDAGFTYGPITSNYSVTLALAGQPAHHESQTDAGSAPVDLRHVDGGSYGYAGGTGLLGDLWANGRLYAASGSDSTLSTGAQHAYELVLAPNTAIALTGNVSIAVANLPGSGGADTGYSSAWVDIRDVGDARHSASWSRSVPTFVASQLSEGIYVPFANAGTTAQRVQLQFGISGRGEVLPVPEPSAYAMFLGGMMLVGAASYRSRGRTSRRSQEGN